MRAAAACTAPTPSRFSARVLCRVWAGLITRVPWYLAPSDTWMRFFTGLEAERKVAVFQQMWELCSGAEQNLIVKDFRFFFFRPGANAAAQAAAAAAHSQ